MVASIIFPHSGQRDCVFLGNPLTNVLSLIIIETPAPNCRICLKVFCSNSYDKGVGWMAELGAKRRHLLFPEKNGCRAKLKYQVLS